MTDKTIEQIREIIDDLQHKKAEIDAQVNEAKRVFASGGKGADVGWLRRAEHASRLTGIDIQHWQVELSKLRKAEKRANSERFEASFIEQARRLLPPETFDMVMRATHLAPDSHGHAQL